MAIDLRICISCNSCTLACKAEHGTQPGVFWCKVLEHESGDYPEVTRLFVPVLCNHCADAHCVKVCPSGASAARDDGIVLVDYAKCIGCKACIAACPYDARTFVEERKFYFPDTPIPHGVEELKEASGVVQKCNLCVQRIDKGEPPACVEVCPTSCRVFGNLDNEGDELVQLMKKEGCVPLLESKGTRPSVYYILLKKQEVGCGPG
ncbi:MAG: 4Fe-4S dicluster domain-containing protein [Deltaproteobacteria bacterium]|nr:4Fe-4S dicluster domain-containing protein [Deltaproteobacteria bacterium]